MWIAKSNQLAQNRNRALAKKDAPQLSLYDEAHKTRKCCLPEARYLDLAMKFLRQDVQPQLMTEQDFKHLIHISDRSKASYKCNPDSRHIQNAIIPSAQ